MYWSGDHRFLDGPSVIDLVGPQKHESQDHNLSFVFGHEHNRHDCKLFVFLGQIEL